MNREAIVRVVEGGGTVGYALLALCFTVWFVVALRTLSLTALWSGLARGPGAIADARDVFDRAERHGALLHALAASATLLGLLGTVAGMVETFDAMQTSTFHTGSERSMASGISTALVSTQLGLVVGIPGMVAAVLLDRLALACRRRVRPEESSS